MATSIYYHSCDDITTSAFYFRQQCDNVLGLDSEDVLNWFPDVYGCDGFGSATQEVGTIEAHEGGLGS